MQLLDVRPDHLKIVQAVLKEFVPDHKVVAFGSRAAGTARNTSDLDLCIMGNERLPFNILANLRDAFSESNLPYKVDVVDWSALDSDFKEVILQKSIDVQSAAAAH